MCDDERARGSDEGGDGTRTPAGNGSNETESPNSDDPGGANGDSRCQTTTLRQREDCAFNFLISKGLTRAQAAAILGNLWWESDKELDPTKLQNQCTPKDDGPTPWSGCGIGLAQWSTDRRQLDLIKFARSDEAPNRNGPLDFEVQLEFLWKELDSKELRRNLVRAAEIDRFKADKAVNRSSVRRLTRLFMRGFEGPGAPALKERRERAQMYFNRYRPRTG